MSTLHPSLQTMVPPWPTLRRVALALAAALIGVQTPAHSSGSPTPTPMDTALQRAVRGVTHNAEWTPFAADFDGVTMMLVPAGQFAMGSTNDELALAVSLCQAAAADPAACGHTLFEGETSLYGDNMQTLSAFWIDRAEVSHAQYQACIAAGQCTAPPASTYSTEPDQPITQVSWDQAAAYCAFRGGDLPTEAQWEYAARGPDRLAFPWGDQFNGARANHCDGRCRDAAWSGLLDYFNLDHDDGYAVTAPVVSYDRGAANGASWVGALNLSGNVSEWTRSMDRGYPYQADDGREQVSGADVLVVRGGSFLDASFVLRAAHRESWYRSNGSGLTGIRCVRPG